MQGRVYAVVLAIWSAACSDDSGGNGNQAGDGGTFAGGGGSVSSAGSSSGQATGGAGNAGSSAQAGSAGKGGGSSGVRGAISLNILQPEGCSLDTQYQDFPKVASGHPVTETEKGAGIADGETTEDFPANVLCDWLANAAVDMVITLGNAGKRRSINLGSDLKQGQPSLSAVVTQFADLPASYGGPCMVTPTEVDQATHSVRGTFTCEDFSPSDDTDHCAIGPSYFFFENCTVK